ncbi:MAG: cobalt-precorrin-6A reductase [Parvularculales bacterium]
MNKVGSKGGDIPLLILGGSSEAITLARTLNSHCDFRNKFHIITSLAGRTGAPRHPPGMVRIGGFGGVHGLARFLREENITLMVDATHPYACRISRNGAVACRLCHISRLHLQRPPWQQVTGDAWQRVPTMVAAADTLPSGARAFLAIGRQEIKAFAGRDDIDLMVRTVDPLGVSHLTPRCTFITGRGPFCVADEQALLEAHNITHLVCRNSGGAGSYAKLEAARTLGIPVIMVDRPPPPPSPRIASVEDALRCIRRLVA